MYVMCSYEWLSATARIFSWRPYGSGQEFCRTYFRWVHHINITGRWMLIIIYYYAWSIMHWIFILTDYWSFFSISLINVVLSLFCLSVPVCMLLLRLIVKVNDVLLIADLLIRMSYVTCAVVYVICTVVYAMCTAVYVICTVAHVMCNTLHVMCTVVLYVSCVLSYVICTVMHVMYTVIHVICTVVLNIRCFKIIFHRWCIIGQGRWNLGWHVIREM